MISEDIINYLCKCLSISNFYIKIWQKWQIIALIRGKFKT